MARSMSTSGAESATPAAITTIIFDFGGVLLRTRDYQGRIAWDKKLGWQHGSAETMYFNSKHGKQAQHGKHTAQAHWEWVAEKLELNDSQLAQFKNDFWAGDELDADLIATIVELKQHYKIGLLSNAMDNLRGELENEFKLMHLFDAVVISAEFGMMKPAREIYTEMLHKLDSNAEEAIFIDDFRRNCEGARVVGMKAINYKNNPQLIKKLQALGVTVSDAAPTPKKAAPTPKKATPTPKIAGLAPKIAIKAAPTSGTISLKSGRSKSIRNRHPWIFSGAIDKRSARPAPGAIVRVNDAEGNYLATGYFNANSQIQVRLLSWDEEMAIDDAFWRSKLQTAFNLREKLGLAATSNAYRLVNAESDGLPGLVVDKYDDVLVVQFLTAGVDVHKPLLTQLLVDLLSPRAIVERSDVHVRRKEGLTRAKGLLWGELEDSEVIIEENGFKFTVDVLRGHKTGFYLDQRANRALVGQPRFCEGKRVLNLFSYSGGFGVYAAKYAKEVIHVDSSAEALNLARENMAQNGFDDPAHSYVNADIFKLLREYRDNGEKFDLIILDPPKFAESQKQLRRATRGYKDLNWLAFRLLNPGGTLATFSCSGLISADLFQKVVFSAAVDAKRDVQATHHLSQGADHPLRLTFPEGTYLKGLLCHTT